MDYDYVNIPQFHILQFLHQSHIIARDLQKWRKSYKGFNNYNVFHRLTTWRLQRHFYKNPWIVDPVHSPYISECFEDLNSILSESDQKGEHLAARRELYTCSDNVAYICKSINFRERFQTHLNSNLNLGNQRAQLFGGEL